MRSTIMIMSYSTLYAFADFENKIDTLTILFFAFFFIFILMMDLYELNSKFRFSEFYKSIKPKAPSYAPDLSGIQSEPKASHDPSAEKSDLP